MWKMQKKGTHPNCTVVLMETGWYHWAAASVVLATRRWMATAGVSWCFGFFCLHVYLCLYQFFCSKLHQQCTKAADTEKETNRERNREREREEKRKEEKRRHCITLTDLQGLPSHRRSLSLQNCSSLLSF